MIFFFCSFQSFNIEYRYLDPLYQINVARLCETGFFYTRLLIKLSFNTEYACRISLIHMIWILALYMLFLSFLTLIIVILIHGIKSMSPHLTRLVFSHDITLKNKFRLCIRVSNMFNSNAMCVLFLLLFSSNLTLNIGIWIYGIKSMMLH